jgi:hypothetical protein
VTSRVQELAAKRRLLLARSAVERETLRLDVAAIGESLGLVDRAVSIVQRLRRSPLVITAALVGLVVFRRHPVTSWVMRFSGKWPSSSVKTLAMSTSWPVTAGRSSVSC